MEILDTFVKSNKHFITNHHLESYNDFVNTFIPRTIKSLNPFTVLKPAVGHEIRIYIGGVDGSAYNFSRPTITNAGKAKLLLPNEARLKNITYQSHLFVDISIEFMKNSRLQKRIIKKNLLICKIPIMLKSTLCNLHHDHEHDTSFLDGECPFDLGGYFIIDGKEKVVIAQENVTTNRLYVNSSCNSKYSFQASIRCKELQSVFPKTHSFYVYAKGSLQNDRANSITMKIPQIGIDYEIPIVMLFRALGVESDLDILNLVASPDDQHIWDFFRPSLLDCNIIHTQAQALQFLSAHVQFTSRDNVMLVLMQNVLPQIENFKDRPKMLGLLVNELINTCLGLKSRANRDHYNNKLIDVTGVLFADVFKDFYNSFRVSTRINVDRAYNLLTGMRENVDIPTDFVLDGHFSSDKLMNGLVKSMKGNWGLAEKKFKGQDATDGVVQDLSRISYMSFLSHLRRVRLPMDTTIKIKAPHQLNGTHWGYMCPCETPDGPAVGIVKNLAFMCQITFSVSSVFLNDILSIPYFNVSPFQYTNPKELYTSTHIRINRINYGTMRGSNRRSLAGHLVKFVKLLRRCAFINIYTSIYWDIMGDTIDIFTEGGRCTRPLLIASKNIDYSRSWNELLGLSNHEDSKYNSASTYTIPAPFDYNTAITHLVDMSEKTCIEFIDANETENCLIQSSNSTVTNRHHSVVVTHHEIHPSTILSLYMSTIPFANHNFGPRNIFAGAHGKQAIGMYATNFPIRIDTVSYILHNAQKPLVSTKFAKYINADKLSNGENLIVAIATYTGFNQEDSVILNKASVDRGMLQITAFKSVVDVEETTGKERIVFGSGNGDGLPTINDHLIEGDVILGRIESNIDGSVSKPIRADNALSGTVDKIVVFAKNGEKSVKIRLRKVLQPEVGDKFASRHSQKGVVGLIIPTESLPFSARGLIPDVIINPHTFPSRATIAHLLECICAKAVAVSGSDDLDGSVFDDHSSQNERIKQILDRNKLEYYGNELLYNGLTGEQIECPIFVTPLFCYRLKHLVSDKINSRQRGRADELTKQPARGRKDYGAQKLGKMEMQSIVAHGAACFIKESIIERSDGVVSGKPNSVFINHTNGETITECYPKLQKISKQTLPYTFKLFKQELQCMNIDMKYSFETMNVGSVDDDCVSDESNEET